VRMRLGVARGLVGRWAQRARHSQPGQPAHGRAHADPGRGRVGARLLLELPEPSPGLPERVVERGQLGRGREALSGGEGLTPSERRSALNRDIEVPAYAAWGGFGENPPHDI